MLRIIYIKRKVIINIALVLILAAASLIYASNFKTSTLGVLLNNERYMPIYCVEVPDRRVSLTFDTSWGDSNVKEIMDVLNRYDIKATFFVTGVWAEKYPELVQEMAEKGYEVGNHSLTHLKMTDLSRKEIINEVRNAETIIKTVSGEKIKLFRAPYGDYNNTLISTVKDLGYSIIQWDVDSKDWEEMTEQDIYNRVISKTSCGSIVLFHSEPENTVMALPSIIEKLRMDGYRFITVSELLLKENYYIDNTGRQRSLK